MALNPYSRENSTYMPVGEARRPNGIVEEYKSSGLDQEVQSVIYALLMQYAKTDGANAMKRAEQFSRILYEYAVKLINDLDINNSVIATKIVKAIDTKIATELKALSASGDFEKGIEDVSGTVREYLSTLIKVANGSLMTISKAGLEQAAEMAKNVLETTSATSGTAVAEASYSPQLPSSFIELIRTTEQKSVLPKTSELRTQTPAMASALQKLAINAITYFNNSVVSFSEKLVKGTNGNLGNLRKSIMSFSSTTAAIARSSSNPAGAVSSLPVAQADPTYNIQVAISRLIKNDNFEQKDVDSWMNRLAVAKKELNVAGTIISGVILAPVKLVSSLFFGLGKHIQETYKEVKNGGFLNYLFSFEGIIVFGTLGYILYKTVFSRIKDSARETVFNALKSSINAIFGIDIDFKQNNGNLFNTPKWVTSVQEYFTDDSNLDDDERLHPIRDYLGWMKEEGGLYSNLIHEVSSDNEKGVGWMMTQMTDHGVENLEALDDYVNRFTEQTFGMSMDEWFNNLNTSETDIGDKTVPTKESGFFGGLKTKIGTFWKEASDAIKKIPDWFSKTYLGEKVSKGWNAVSSVATEMWKKYEPFIQMAVAVAPFVGLVTYVIQSPIGRMVRAIGKIGKLLVAMCRFEFMKPIIGAVGNVIKSSPLAGLLIAGIALGLGILGVGIWNAFHKVPKTDSSITPYDHYAIQMGLAKGQENESVAEFRFAKMRTTLIESGDQTSSLAKAVQTLGEGVTKFNRNYGDAMTNQDKKQKGTLHWFIINRRDNASLANSNWGEILSELPILGIGPGLAHSDLFGEFRSRLDSKFSERSEKSWSGIIQMMTRMKSVDTEFRKHLTMADDSQIQKFFEYVKNNKSDIKDIYDWTHNEGSGGFNLSKKIESMFGLTEKMSRIPKVDMSATTTITSVGSQTPAKVKITVDGRVFEFEMKGFNVGGFLNAFTGTIDRKGYADRGGGVYTTTWSDINPMLAAKAFVNYMQRPNSPFRTWSPWNFSDNDVKNLENVGDSFRMKDLINEMNLKREISIHSIAEEHKKLGERNYYQKLPDIDGQNDSKSMAQVVYILGAILKMCDEIE